MTCWFNYWTIIALLLVVKQHFKNVLFFKWLLITWIIPEFLYLILKFTILLNDLLFRYILIRNGRKCEFVIHTYSIGGKKAAFDFIRCQWIVFSLKPCTNSRVQYSRETMNCRRDHKWLSADYISTLLE